MSARFQPWIVAALGRDPGRPLLQTEEGGCDAQMLFVAAGQLAAGLAAEGLRTGDLLALRAPAGRAFVTAFHAASWLGLRLLPVNARLSEPEVLAQLQVVKPTRFLDGEAAIQACAAAGAGQRTPQPYRWRSREIAQVLFTSGTAGLPKAACLSMGSLVWSVLAGAAQLGAVPGDRWLACLPLFHVGGLSILARSALLGASVLVHDRFDAERVSRALDEEAVTLLSLVPTTLKRLLRARRGRPAPAALRAVLVGGAAAPPELVLEARRCGIPALPTYGLTETASQLATATARDPLAAGAVGRPLLGSTLRIVDAEGKALAAGQEGEILASGPTLFSGYLGDPEATARSLQEGWLHTGDVGVLDESGRLRVFERRRDLIVSGGENVHPGEVEAVLLTHPAVAEAAVGGAPDAELGSRVVAWVVLCAEVPLETLLQHCRACLAAYKLPRELHLVHELPRNASGKLLRRRLSEGPPNAADVAGRAWRRDTRQARQGSP